MNALWFGLIALWGVVAFDFGVLWRGLRLFSCFWVLWFVIVVDLSLVSCFGGSMWFVSGLRTLGFLVVWLFWFLGCGCSFVICLVSGCCWVSAFVSLVWYVILVYDGYV